MNTFKFSLFCSLAICLCLLGCSKSNDSDKPDNPDVPVADEDWHTVPVNGGDINLDDFTISLPAGTFDTETKMAVKNVQAGQVCSENEASAFYQVTMPITTHKPMTVKVASKDLGEGVSLVMHSESYMTSTGKTIPSDVYMETSYEDGAYTATIPEMSNGSDDEKLSFAVGLVKVPALEKEGTRGFLTYDTDLKHGEVEGVKWAIYPDPSIAYNDKIWSGINQDTHNVIGQYIEESMKLLFKMGFKLKKGYGKRVVKFYYKRYYDYFVIINNLKFKTGDINIDFYGGFEASALSDMESTVGISIDRLVRDSKDAEWVAPTIIHELFHYFQYDLDNRWQVNKATGIKIDNRSILYEMASVWSEQFMNNGELNKTFLFDHFGEDVKFGMGMEKERIKKVKDPMSEQGYILGPWLHYLVKEIERQNLRKKQSKHPVCELFDLYAEKWVNDTYNAYPILNEWLESYSPTDANGNTWWNMDDYYLQLWTGKLVKNFNIHLCSGTNAPTFSGDFKKIVGEGECYPFGCCVNKFYLNGYQGIDLKDKELVVKQENPSLKTYMLITSKKDFSKYTIYGQDDYVYASGQGDSIVLRGEELEALRKPDGTFNHEIFFVTTNITNPKLKNLNTSTDKAKPSRATIELRDVTEKPQQLTVKPKVLEFEAEGGEQSIIVNKGSFQYCNCFFNETTWENGIVAHTYDWGEYMSAEFKNDSTIVVTVPKNNSAQNRTIELTVRAANKPHYLLNKEKDEFKDAKVTIRQKGGTFKTVINYVSLQGDIRNMINDKNGNKEGMNLKSSAGITIYRSRNESTTNDSGVTDSRQDTITVERVGKGIHVTGKHVNETVSDLSNIQKYEIVFSFDVNDCTGETASSVTNFSYQEIYTVNGENYWIKDLKANDIPFVRKNTTYWEWFGGQNKNILNVNSAKLYLGSYYGDYEGNYTYTPNDQDYLKIGIEGEHLNPDE